MKRQNHSFEKILRRRLQILRTVPALLLAVVMAVSLTACGGGSNGSGQTATGTSDPNSTDKPGSSVENDGNPAGQSSGRIEKPEETEANAGDEAEYERACTLFEEGRYYSARAAFENSGYGDWEERAAACVQPMPGTGVISRAENMASDEMELVFVVNAADESVGRFISVYTEDHVLAAELFILGSGSAEVGLPGGRYYVKDASGTEWYGADEQFGPDGYYENMVFDEVEGDRYLTVLDAGYVWTITINTSTTAGQGVGSERTGWEDRN